MANFYRLTQNLPGLKAGAIFRCDVDYADRSKKYSALKEETCRLCKRSERYDCCKSFRQSVILSYYNFCSIQMEKYPEWFEKLDRMTQKEFLMEKSQRSQKDGCA